MKHPSISDGTAPDPDSVIIRCGFFDREKGICDALNKPCDQVSVNDCPITKDVEDYITILTEKKPYGNRGK